MSVLPERIILHPPAHPESPSLLRGAADAPAFEVKFLLTGAQAAEAERRLRARLSPDPHADPTGHYRVTSVYFDTPTFAVFHRADGYRRRKFRVRRYGSAPTAFLEQKSRSGPEVKKRRTAVPLPDLDRLFADPAADWPGGWFAARLAARGLRPVVRVSYERIALVGTGGDGPVRVTFDRAAVGTEASGPVPERVIEGKLLLADEVVAEFKFLGGMPAAFKDVIAELRLEPRGLSKYRRCATAVGLVGGVPNA